MLKAKRFIGLGLAVCMGITMVAGCGNKAASTDTTAPSSTVAADSSVAAEPSKALDPVELKWYAIGNGQPKDMDKVLEKVNEWLKPRINATLKLNIFTFGDDFEQKMAAKVSSGEEFDITFTSAWALNYGQNSAKGAFVDLTPMLDKYAPKTKAALGDKVIKGASINGKLYAIPTKKEMSHNWGFLVRKDLAEKYQMDLSTIKKFEDIEPMLKTIKEKEPGVYPFSATVGESPYRLLDFEKQVDDNCPGAIYGDFRDTKVINDYDTPETKALLDTVHKWYQAGYIRKDADAVTDFSQDLRAGKTFSIIRSLKPGKDAEDALAYNQKLIQVDLTKPVATTREMTGAMQAISKSSKNPERALMFLELINTEKELINLVNFGIEGTHYKKIDDNTIDSIKPAVDSYNPGTPWMFANQFNTYLFPSEDKDKWAKFDKFNADGTPSPLLGYSFNVEPVKTKVAALTAIKRQYFPGLECGKADPATVLPQMNKKFADAGLAEVLAEMQKQVDAFKASNK
jgi:putative aldouronate transport system substrate-binding protein